MDFKPDNPGVSIDIKVGHRQFQRARVGCPYPLYTVELRTPLGQSAARATLLLFNSLLFLVDQFSCPINSHSQRAEQQIASKDAVASDHSGRTVARMAGKLVLGDPADPGSARKRGCFRFRA